MRRNVFYIFITLLFVVFSTACAAETDAEPETKETVPAADLLKKAEDFYREREDLAKLREAIANLKRARRAEASNFDAAWKLAQANYFLGKSHIAFADGVNAARVAIKLAPDKPDGHFWLGANLGGEAEKSPYTKGITVMGEIREAMRKVIEIDPSYQRASAYDALAQLELKGAFAGGKAEKALEFLEKGVSINQTNPYLYLHRAEAYIALDRDADAKKQIELLLKMKPNPDLHPEYKDAERQAKKLLETKF